MDREDLHQSGELEKRIENSTSYSDLSSAPIDRLPGELVVEFLKCVHACVFNSRPVETAFYRWMQLLHVCSRWRDLIFSVSYMWRIVCITSRSKLSEVEFCLSLCGSSSLEIRIHEPATLLLSASVRLLGPYTSRIQRLTLFTFHFNNLRPSFDEVLALNMPSLEEFFFVPHTVTNNVSRQPIFALHQYPLLRRLQLKGLTCPLNIPCTYLRVLHFQSCSWPFTLDDFIHTLSRCVQLEELRLYHSLGMLSFPLPHLITPNVGRAKLERLRVLKIEDHTADIISAVLTHIEAPSIRSLRVLNFYQIPVLNGRALSPASPRRVWTFLPVDPSRVLPQFTAPVRATIRYSALRTGTCTLEVSTLPEAWQSIPVSIELLSNFRDTWKGALCAALQDFSRVCANVHVTALTIEGPAENVPPAAWTELFTTLPILETFTLVNTSTSGAVAIWEGLRHGSGSATNLCCPRLASVHVRTTAPQEGRDAEADRRGIGVVRDTLCRRAQQGAKLQELVWEARGPSHADAHTVRNEFLKQVSPFVERMVYKMPGEQASAEKAS